MGSSLRSSAKDFRMAWGELFLYAWSCLYRYWLIPAPARLLACGQPCSEKTRPKENTNAPNFAKPLSQPSSPPRSGFVQQKDRANDGERQPPGCSPGRVRASVDNRTPLRRPAYRDVRRLASGVLG